MKTSYEFTHAISRTPGDSVVRGIRDVGQHGQGSDPDPAMFKAQHAQYIAALTAAGLQVINLDPSEEFPDSVFVEDAALCIGNTAIVLRPGASSRAGEGPLIRPALETIFSRVIELPGSGTVDGGDILVAENVVFVGESARTSSSGLGGLSKVLADLGYETRKVITPNSVLHFKTACGLLDEKTIFADKALSITGCFEGFTIIDVPEGEEAAANLIRVNDTVMISSGYPMTSALLAGRGYQVVEIDTGEAAALDGGLSCMSLRFNLDYKPG